MVHLHLRKQKFWQLNRWRPILFRRNFLASVAALFLNRISRHFRLWSILLPTENDTKNVKSPIVGWSRSPVMTHIVLFTDWAMIANGRQRNLKCRPKGRGGSGDESMMSCASAVRGQSQGFPRNIRDYDNKRNTFIIMLIIILYSYRHFIHIARRWLSGRKVGYQSLTI